MGKRAGALASATDRDGNTIHVGDRVIAISKYDGRPMSECGVISIHRSGRRISLLLDTPPDPRFPHHMLHTARSVTRIRAKESK